MDLNKDRLCESRNSRTIYSTLPEGELRQAISDKLFQTSYLQAYSTAFHSLIYASAKTSGHPPHLGSPFMSSIGIHADIHIFNLGID